MTRMMVAGVLVVALLTGTGMAGPPEGVLGRMVCEDADLVASVRRAERSGVAPQAVETFVGREAAASTLRDRRVLLDFAIGLDVEGRPSPSRGDGAPLPRLEWTERTQVVYWARPATASWRGERRLVGIVWDDKGTARAFFGVVTAERVHGGVGQ